MSASVYDDVCQQARAYGVKTMERPMEPGKAAEFDGVSITMNPSYAVVERAYYLVHALGSMVRWSLSHREVQAMFDELRDAKKDKNKGRLESAIVRYREFETESSDFAVWLLGQIGHASEVSSYTNFMRADLEALTQYHRTGQAPVWQEFFGRWNEEIVAGRRVTEPFRPKEIPPFSPRQTEKQEILQKQPD